MQAKFLRNAPSSGNSFVPDKAVQQYFKARHYSQVEVFCMEGVCRNNVGWWPVRSIMARSNKKDFSYYSIKDQAMTEEAGIGFMIWDGRSIGTLANVYRLISQNKTVVVYMAPSRQFTDLKTQADWESFIAPYGNDPHERIMRIIEKRQKPFQVNLISGDNSL